MTSSEITGSVIAAVLVFWAVGAYNRLVRLRNEIARSFTPVEAQMRQRHALLERWVEVLRPVLVRDPDVLDAMTGACSQLLAACDVTRGRSSEARPMARLRLAEDTLAEARRRIQARLVASATVPQDPAYAALADEMANADTALAFARRQYNEASQNYNDALDQFPTWVIAGLFGFRGAGSL
jgi:LemA protein